MWQKKLRIKPAVFMLLVLLSAAALFTGCPGPVDPTPESLLPLPDGWYKGSALPPYDDGYGIEANILTHYNDGNKAVDFAGQVESYNNNVAIIKITTGSEWGPSAGKYYGVYIGGATGFSFTGSSAYKTNGANSGVDTLEAAQAEYTDGKEYFDYKAGYGRYAGEAAITGIDGGLEVSWTAVPGAAGYDVYFTETTTPPASAADGITTNVTITGTAAVITGLTETASYNVWIRAKSASRTGAWVYQGSVILSIIPAKLNGYFQSLPYSPLYAFYDDGFTVDVSEKTFYYYGDSTFEKKWGGTIVKIVPEGDAYVIIVRVDEVTGSWDPAPETGKYFAAAYKNLTDFAVNSNTAVKIPGGNNTGAATVGEAVSEYTIVNGYFDYLDTTLYYPHAASAETLTALQGNWYQSDEDDGDPDYRIHIRGTKLIEWYDDGDGIYDADDDDGMLAELGDIVDHTNTAQNSGILYVKVINSDFGFSNGKFFAVGWKNLNGSGVSFMTNFGGAATSNAGFDSLAAAKAALTDANNASQFSNDGFYDYAK
jgi:hypothetical protein